MPIPTAVSHAVQQLFARPPLLVVLGAHTVRHRAAWYVTDYLQSRGAHILPVNPRFAGQPIHDAICLASLAKAAASPMAQSGIDAVVVFRASEALRGHQQELLDAAPRLVWFQQGIRDDRVAAALEQGGIPVVQDRCLKVDHARVFGFSRAMGGQPPSG